MAAVQRRGWRPACGLASKSVAQREETLGRIGLAVQARGPAGWPGQGSADARPVWAVLLSPCPSSQVFGTGWTGPWWRCRTGVGPIASLAVDLVVRTPGQEVLTAPYTLSTAEAVRPFIAGSNYGDD